MKMILGSIKTSYRFNPLRFTQKNRTKLIKLTLLFLPFDVIFFLFSVSDLGYRIRNKC